MKVLLGATLCLFTSLVEARRETPGISLQQTKSGGDLPPQLFVDEYGRIRVFHGANMVVKGPPWIPDVSEFSSDLSLTEEDFQIMDMLGLNMMRLGVMWPGVEPEVSAPWGLMDMYMCQ